MIHCEYKQIKDLPESFPENWIGATFFCQKSWLEIVAGMELGEVGVWQGSLSGEPVMIMPCLSRSTILGRMAFLPPLTPYWGLLWKPDLVDKTLLGVLNQIVGKLTGWRIALPPYVSSPHIPKPHREKKHTTRIITSKTEEELWQNLATSCRQKIRAARNEGLKISESSPEEFTALMYETFYRRGVRFSLDQAHLLHCLKMILMSGLGIIRKVSSKEGKPLSMRLVLNDKSRKLSYDIAAASTANLHGGAGNLLLWEEILTENKKGYTLDLVGTGVTGVAEFKRSFGGEEQLNLISEIFPNLFSEWRYRLGRRLGMLP